MLAGKCALVVLVAGTLPLLGAGRAAGEIYKWVDGQGQVHFQDHPPPQDGKASAVEVRESTPPPAPAPPDAPGVPVQAAAPGATGAPVEPPPRPPVVATVELYTVAWCPWCGKAREYFRSRGVPFTDYDIEKDAAAAQRKNALDTGTGVPFAVINGVRVSGYSPERYARALNAPAQSSPPSSSRGGR
jgi:glutaredoxin